jgi:hypothetical protein
MRKQALMSLCNGTMRLPYRLGAYLCRQHIPVQWYTNANATVLYRANQYDINTHFDIFSQAGGLCQTRFWTSFEFSHSIEELHPGTLYATVDMVTNIQAVLHLSAPLPVQLPSPTTFFKTLHSLGNPNLWTNLYVDGDREWLQEGLLRRSLKIACDGLYMPDLSNDVCSTAVTIYCVH